MLKPQTFYFFFYKKAKIISENSWTFNLFTFLSSWNIFLIFLITCCFTVKTTI